MIIVCIILLLIILTGIMVNSTLDRKMEKFSNNPTIFEIHNPILPEKLYCLYCGKLKDEKHNICHTCKHYHFVTLDELVHNLCRDVKR